MRNVAWFEVSPELLEDALRLPPDARIVAVSSGKPGRYSGPIGVLVEAEGLPSREEGELAPKIKPTLTKHVDDAGNETVTWEWGHRID